MTWQLAVEVVGALLFVDFFSGLVHWFEDQYGTRNMHPWIVEYIVKPNRLHHIYPRRVVHCPRWISLAQGVGPAIVFFPMTILVLGWRMGLIATAMSTIPNFVHKWNHMRDSERPRLVKLLQACYILQGPSHHHTHHVNRTDTAYCVVTPFLNPVLDAINFWRGVEWLIFAVTGRRANDPDEPHAYYRVHGGKIQEYQLAEGIWTEWPDFEKYQRPVR